MESTCSERFLSTLSDETECYLYPKRMKIESNQKSTEKEEQQKLEESIHCVNGYQTSPHEPVYLSERQTSWALEKQSCDPARKLCMREFFHFQTCSNERLPYRVSESKLSTKKWSTENEDQNTVENDNSLNVHEQALETQSPSMWGADNMCKNLQVLNPPQAQQNNNIEQNTKRNSGNELKQNSSVTPWNRDLFQMELLSHKSVSDKKWKQYQLLQIPFLCGTSSVFSHLEHEKNNFMKKVRSTEDKDYFSSDNETTAGRDNKDKNNSSYIIPALKPFKSIQPLEIPNFQLPSISNKINSKISSTNLKESDWKNFRDQPSLMQSKQMYGVQKMSEIGRRRSQNDKNSINTSTIGSELKEENCPSISKQEHSALAERGKVSVTYIDADRKECVKSKELQINSDNFLSKKSFSLFDTYEKIPLTTDSEDFDQIPIAKETVQFSLQGHTQTNKAVSLEPATLKQHLEYVKEQEEISDEQMHETNESQCETVMNDLIMSYSEDESKTFIAAEEKLKMHLSVMNNGCLEDVKDKYLPLGNKITYEFELKRKFDLVLEELRMFHEISKGNENNLSSLETNLQNNYCELNNSKGTDENVTSVSQKKICVSSPICGAIEGQNITDSNESSLNENITNENKDQKVSKEYCISRLSSEELLHSPITEGNFDAAYKKPYTWDPAFLSCRLLKEQNYNLHKEGGYFLSHEVIRVQPLKTCKGPIRIGLSRKARPKQLHPYLK
ncbi:PREDICTED: RAD51-associated protein 2 [Charadrius vociferus]|uniref:RAD51-associated protein 2 n=1 Tax=Charadrius vociferus TaxID=50402 RepID=UPI0005212B98|nr:PREDICTED: RAD51-associated protein 2 [Charadrius vociferus]